MFEELAAAHACGLAPDELYAMVTDTPARMLCLPEGAGTLAAGAPADWIALRDRGGTPAEALLDEPILEAVFLAGRPHLLSEQLARSYPQLSGELTPLRVGERNYWLQADVRGLLKRTRAALGANIALNGAAVTEWSP